MPRKALNKIGISGLILLGAAFVFVFFISRHFPGESVALALNEISPIIASSQIVATPTSPRVVGIDMQFASNLADNRVLLGASHNVFAGKVVGRVGTKIVPAVGRPRPGCKNKVPTVRVSRGNSL